MTARDCRNRGCAAPAAAGLALALLCLAAPAARAQDGSWNSTTAPSGGSWGNAANWNGSVIASGAGNTATFGLDFNANASVTLDGGRTIGTITTSSANAWSIDPGTGGTLTVADFNVTGAGAVTVTAAMAGASLSKDGTGTLTLSSPGSIYSGAININAGTLALTGSGNYSPGSNVVTVASGATLDVSGLTGGTRFGGNSRSLSLNNGDTLDGTGTVDGGIQVNSGATVYPGVNGVGTLHVTGSINFASGSNWKVRLGSANPGPSNTSNALSGTGSLTLATGVNMPIDGTGLTFTVGQTYTYTIATLSSSNFGIGAVNFQPTNFGQPGIAPASSFSLVTNGSNLNLQFTPVPEPATVLAVASVGFGLVGGIRRFSRPG